MNLNEFIQIFYIASCLLEEPAARLKSAVKSPKLELKDDGNRARVKRQTSVIVLIRFAVSDWLQTAAIRWLPRDSNVTPLTSGWSLSITWWLHRSPGGKKPVSKQLQSESDRLETCASHQVTGAIFLWLKASSRGWRCCVSNLRLTRWSLQLLSINLQQSQQRDITAKMDTPVHCVHVTLWLYFTVF